MNKHRGGGTAIPLYLMAKAPVAGRVKTRMTPRLNAQRAAQLSHAMLAQTLATACEHWRGEVVLCASPAAEHPAFIKLTRAHGVAATTQLDADLGARMLHALQTGVARAGRAAVMGCDVPHCPPEIYRQLHSALMRGENPLGESEDGGFYCIGLQADCINVNARNSSCNNLFGNTLFGNTLFNDINWHSADTAAAVRANAQRLGVKFHALPRLRDIDHYADLTWLASIDARYQKFIV